MNEDLENINFDSLPDILKQELDDKFPPQIFEPDYSKVLVLDNVPIVEKKDENRKGLLKKVLRQQIEKAFGPVLQFEVPEEDGNTLGYAFVEFETVEAFEKALIEWNDHRFDKNHVFKTCRFVDFDMIDQVDDEYIPPPEVTFGQTENLTSWLLEPYGCDQFVIRYDNETEVLWNGKTGSLPHTEIKRTNWTRKNWAIWSPLGSYLVMVQENVVELYGGPNWEKLKEFYHEKVDDVDFSPDEKFLITFSNELSQNDDEKDPQGIVIWEIVTQAKRRSFTCVFNQTKQNTLFPIWPSFQWSYDSSYFSRLYKGFIMIYDSNTMSLIDNKPVKLHAQCTEHFWSPSDPYLACYVPSPPNKNLPSRVQIFSFPGQHIVTQKNLRNIVNCHLSWHGKGDYLALKIDRLAAKGKKQEINTSFEIFKLRERDIPIEPLMLEEYVVSFSWESNGNRFAVVHGQDEIDIRPNVSFYELTPKELKKIVTLEKRPVSRVKWSPTGRFVLFAGTKPALNGALEFYDVDDQTSLTSNLQHPLCSDIEWDPTGRYVVTSVSAKKSKMENGYKLWTFYGVELREERKNVFYQFSWRPHPPTLLPIEKINWLKEKDNFQEFRDRYKKEDRLKREEELRERTAKREELRRSYIEYMRERLEVRESEGFYLDEEEEPIEEVEEIVVEVLESTEEILHQ